MLVAKIRIKTADSFIEVGESVKGLLSKNEIKQFKSLGYVGEDVVAVKPAKGRLNVTRTQKAAKAEEVDENSEAEETGEEESEEVEESGGDEQRLPPGLNENL